MSYYIKDILRQLNRLDEEYLLEDIEAMKKYYPDELAPVMGKYISPELIDYLWDEFEKNRELK